jgi:hypothetical protein
VNLGGSVAELLAKDHPGDQLDPEPGPTTETRRVKLVTLLWVSSVETHGSDAEAFVASIL